MLQHKVAFLMTIGPTIWSLRSIPSGSPRAQPKQQMSQTVDVGTVSTNEVDLESQLKPVGARTLKRRHILRWKSVLRVKTSVHHRPHSTRKCTPGHTTPCGKALVGCASPRGLCLDPDHATGKRKPQEPQEFHIGHFEALALPLKVWPFLVAIP